MSGCSHNGTTVFTNLLVRDICRHSQTNSFFQYIHSMFERFAPAAVFLYIYRKGIRTLISCNYFKYLHISPLHFIGRSLRRSVYILPYISNTCFSCHTKGEIVPFRSSRQLLIPGNRRGRLPAIYTGNSIRNTTIGCIGVYFHRLVLSGSQRIFTARYRIIRNVVNNPMVIGHCYCSIFIFNRQLFTGTFTGISQFQTRSFSGFHRNSHLSSNGITILFCCFYRINHRCRLIGRKCRIGYISCRQISSRSPFISRIIQSPGRGRCQMYRISDTRICIVCPGCQSK